MSLGDNIAPSDRAEVLGAGAKWWRRLHVDYNLAIGGYVRTPKLFCPRGGGLDIRIAMQKDSEGDVHFAGLVLSVCANKL
jgi:hypothetical protein